MDSLSVWIEKLLYADPEKGTKVITIIGSGGKTSLIWHLAAYFVHQELKVLVSPTTKMLPIKPVPGITLAGYFNEASGKLEALPGQTLEKMISDFDLVLIEGDGAKGLPLKGWADHEPVVPSFTTLTIGMLPLWPLGKPVSEEIIHRLPLFLTLTGASIGDNLKHDDFLKLLTGNEIQPGLFTKACGKKLLFLNGAEDEEAVSQAREIIGILPAEFRENLNGIITGSVRDDKVLEL